MAGIPGSGLVAKQLYRPILAVSGSAAIGEPPCGCPQVLRFLLKEMLLQAGRQITRVKKRLGIHRHHVVDAVFQLSHIARPVIGENHFHRFGSDGMAHLRSQEKVTDENWDILLRSRRGASRTLITFRRKYRSRRNAPIFTSAARSQLVAAIMRKSDRRVVVDPTGRNSFSCSTRSSFA
jgi:hypothetical protein